MLLPSMQEALAVAHLLQKRCNAAVAEMQHKCSELEREVEQLRAAAAAPPVLQPPQPPLLQVVAAEQAGTASQATAPGSSTSADPDALQRQLRSLALWHQAAAVLPPDLQPVLARAQRYLLLGELQQPVWAGGLPGAALLERTPVRAMLELTADILQTHAAAAAAAASIVPAAPPAPAAPSLLSPAHDELLSAACSCLVHLCEHPGQTALDADYADLQQFCYLVLQLAAALPADAAPALAVCTPDQQHSAASMAQAQRPAQEQSKGLGADLRQPTYQLAQHVLSMLRQSASAGTVLLTAAATQTRDCMGALVAAITGEQLPLFSAPSGTVSTVTGSASSQQAGAPDSVGGTEEACLLHAFIQLSQQLSAGLRLLPLWVRGMGLHSDASFMQGLASAVLSSREVSELISVTHPAAARQMQRVAAQMVGALQLIAADGGAGAERGS